VSTIPIEKKVAHKIQTKIFVVLQVSCQRIPRYFTFSLYPSFRVADSWLDFPFDFRKKWITSVYSILHFTMTMIDSRYRPQREQIKQLRFFHSYDACIFMLPWQHYLAGVGNLVVGLGEQSCLLIPVGPLSANSYDESFLLSLHVFYFLLQCLIIGLVGTPAHPS
jgi:hypothetical protein